jgi:hypothetical protein
MILITATNYVVWERNCFFVYNLDKHDSFQDLSLGL